MTVRSVGAGGPGSKHRGLSQKMALVRRSDQRGQRRRWSRNATSVEGQKRVSREKERRRHGKFHVWERSCCAISKGSGWWPLGEGREIGGREQSCSRCNKKD